MVTDPRQAVAAVLAIADASTEPPVSESDLLRLAIGFANESALRGALLRVPMPGMRGNHALIELSRLKGLPLSLDVSGDPDLVRVREQFREDLAAVIDAGDDALPARTVSRLKRDGARVVRVPRYAFAAGRLRVTEHHIPESLDAVLAFCVLLLRDDSRPFRADFARCKLKRCGKFFFRSDTVKGQGRQRQAYCCDEHMLEQHRATGALRVQRHRAREAVKAAAKHK